jgi:transmembrane 9 superfamily protein 2/4
MQQASELKTFGERIGQEYRVQWLLDNLPAAMKKLTIDASGKTTTVYDLGFPLGYKGKDDKYYLHNHVNIKVLYNQDESNQKRIVGFEVDPESIAFPYDPSNPDSVPSGCSRIHHGVSDPPQTVSLDSETWITWTYSVKWEVRDIKWASRWDIYLLMTDNQIHWFSIINSLIIVLLLTGMVGMIMMRTLNADLRRYREMEASPDVLEEETGWKLVHGDVFRPPSHPMLLSVFVGTGVQIFAMLVITMVFAVLGFLSPANRGGLMTALVILFVAMGSFAGYFSARIYKLFKGLQWKRNMTLTALLFPGTVFVIFLVLNFVLAYEGSSGAVPFGTLFA